MALMLVTPAPGERAAPPENLSAAEAAIWKETVASKPADYFPPDCRPILAAYCRAVATSDRLAPLIKRALAKTDPESVATLESLLKIRDREGRAMATYARSMRLTHQQRYRADAAAVAHRRGCSSVGAKPWD